MRTDCLSIGWKGIGSLLCKSLVKMVTCLKEIKIYNPEKYEKGRF
jgi:hypothetical protein